MLWKKVNLLYHSPVMVAPLAVSNGLRLNLPAICSPGLIFWLMDVIIFTIMFTSVQTQGEVIVVQCVYTYTCYLTMTILKDYNETVMIKAVKWYSILQ